MLTNMILSYHKNDTTTYSSFLSVIFSNLISFFLIEHYELTIFYLYFNVTFMSIRLLQKYNINC